MSSQKVWVIQTWVKSLLLGSAAGQLFDLVDILPLEPHLGDLPLMGSMRTE